MTVARDQYSRANSDALGAFGDAGEMHPYVVAKSRNLRRPYTLVAKLLREHCLVERLRTRRQAEGVSQRHNHSTGLRLKQLGDKIADLLPEARKTKDARDIASRSGSAPSRESTRLLFTSACSPSRTYADGVWPRELDLSPPSMGKTSSARSAPALPFPLPRHRDEARYYPA